MLFKAVEVVEIVEVIVAWEAILVEVVEPPIIYEPVEVLISRHVNVYLTPDYNESPISIGYLLEIHSIEDTFLFNRIVISKIK